MLELSFIFHTKSMESTVGCEKGRVRGNLFMVKGFFQHAAKMRTKAEISIEIFIELQSLFEFKEYFFSFIFGVDGIGRDQFQKVQQPTLFFFGF